jgi:hypothetical protein
MANVKKWSYSTMFIDYGKGFMENISVDSAIMDADLQCFHCGKNIKEGKLVFCGRNYSGALFEFGDKDWGEGDKKTFCSSNHAKLFAKNNKGF